MDLPETLPNIDKSDIDKEILKFTLSLYNNPFLSRKAVDEAIQNFSQFISNHFVPYIQKKMEIHVKPISSEIAYSKSKFVLENVKDVFNNFSTEHLRFKQYEEKSLYIPPQLFEIGQEPTYITKEDKSIHVDMKSKFAVHVPLKDTLQTVLSVPGILDSILKYMNDLSTETKYLSNVVQGELWMKKYANSDKIIIPLYLSFDEFETRNPLGSHAGEEKLGGVYVSIASLPPNASAKLKNQFLSTIFYSKHLKIFGNEKIFRKSIEDLQFLSTTGITINLNRSDQTIFFELVQILGDNLGQNMICGFTDSFKSNYYCRICTASNKQCQEMIEENEDLLRDIESYEEDITGNNLAESSIKEECIFNKINKFHIAENMSLDPMHDVPEGVADYTMSKAIEGIISTEKISLQTINNRIETFEFNELEISNRPRPLFYTVGQKGGRKIKIKQSASEMLCLIRYFGLMIGDLVSAKNPYWKIYLVLRKIVGIITSPTLDRGQIQLLGELIKEHNKQYIQLFGKLKPKMHFLLHYPRIILLFGPAVHFSAMKLERKNRQLKEYAVGTMSNINLPLTVSIKHQLELCYKTEFCSSVQKDVTLGVVENSNAYTNLKSLIPNLPTEVPVMTLKNIEILGNKLSPGTVIVTRISENGPHFGLIKTIFLCENIYLELKELKTLFFHHHFHAYCVRSTENSLKILINVDMIPKTSPCLLVTKSANEFIATRYDI